MNNATQIAHQIEEIWMREWQVKLGPDATLSEDNQAKLHGLRVELDALQARCDKLEAAARDAIDLITNAYAEGRAQKIAQAQDQLRAALRSVVDGVE